MRSVIAAIVTLAGCVLAAAPAHACRIADGPVYAKLFWDTPPASLEPGEVVLKVLFDRTAVLRGDAPDTIVIDCTTRSIFSVVESRPLTSAVSEIVIVGSLEFEFRTSEPKYVVGKLAPSSEVPTGGHRLQDADASAWLFKPR